jgi:excisionase family DNA binding protein
LEPSQQKSIDTEPLAVTVAEACRLTGLGATNIWKLIGEGKIKVARIGRRTLPLFASLKLLLTPDHDDEAAQKRSAAARRLRGKRAKGATSRREQVRAEA